MAAEFGIQRLLLFTHRVVPVLFAPVVDRLYPSAETFGERLHVHCELAVSAMGADVRETEESEGPGFLPCRLAFLTASRPNSISRVFSGCKVRPYFPKRSASTFNTFTASSLC